MIFGNYKTAKTMRKFLPFLWIATFGLMTSASAEPALQNGNFDEALEGWTHTPTVQLQSGKSADGGNYALLSSEGLKAERIVRLQTTISGLVEGGNYKLSCKSRKSTADEVRIIIRDLETNKYIVHARPSPEMDWTESVMRFKAPAASVGLEVRMISPGECEIDNFQIHPTD